MVSQKVKILNPSGLNLGSATTLSNSVLKYQSAVQFTYEANDVKGVANMKSILNILAAEVNQGQVIEISCTGDDEEEALKSVLDAEIVELANLFKAVSGIFADY